MCSLAGYAPWPTYASLLAIGTFTTTRSQPPARPRLCFSRLSTELADAPQHGFGHADDTGNDVVTTTMLKAQPAEFLLHPISDNLWRTVVVRP